MEMKGHHFSAETKRVAVECGGVEGQTALEEDHSLAPMSTAILMHLVAHVRDHPDRPVKPWKMGTGLQNLVESMPRRLAEVIGKGGNPTKY